MDRKITRQKHPGFCAFEQFKYLDLFPYTIALLVIAGEVYILNAFINISHNLH